MKSDTEVVPTAFAVQASDNACTLPPLLLVGMAVDMHSLCIYMAV